MHLLAERFVFWGDERGFLKKVAKTYLKAPTSPRSAFASTVYGVVVHQKPGPVAHKKSLYYCFHICRLASGLIQDTGKLIKGLGFLLPVGLFLAALPPNVINVAVTGTAGAQLANRFTSSLLGGR